VTIFGESAGSWSVNHLMATPLANGLFHRAVGESGGGFGSFGTVISKAEAEVVGEKFAAALAGGNTPPSLDVLRAKMGDEVMKPQVGRMAANIDGWVFPDSIYNIFAAGKQHDVPVIVGSNADETSTPTTLAEYTKAAREYGPLASVYLKTYAASNDAEAANAHSASQTDQRFGWEMRTWARMMETVSSKAYLYFFSRVPPGPEPARRGAYHAAEIVYVFGNLGKSPYPYANRSYDEVDRKLSNLMRSYWVNFATNGDPNGEGLPAWPASMRTADEALEFGDTVQVRKDVRSERLDFMDKYYAARRTATN
jgi:para-nitrobenzyl esterase